MAPQAPRLWSPRILIPLWTIQIILSLANLALYIAIAAPCHPYRYTWGRFCDIRTTSAVSNFHNLSFAAQVVLILIFALWILVDMMQIFLFCAGRLAPVVMLVMQIVANVFWVVWFVLTLLMLFDGSAASFPPAILAMVAWLCSLGYSAVVVHRCRKGRRVEGGFDMEGVGKGGRGYSP